MWPWKDKPKNNVVPLRRADRPEVLTKLRRNAEYKRVQLQPQRESLWEFQSMPWTSVDDVLHTARSDLHRGLVTADSCLIAFYDETIDRIVWYQFGMSDKEIGAALDEWRNGL